MGRERPLDVCDTQCSAAVSDRTWTYPIAGYGKSVDVVKSVNDFFFFYIFISAAVVGSECVRLAAAAAAALCTAAPSDADTLKWIYLL